MNRVGFLVFPSVDPEEGDPKAAISDVGDRAVRWLLWPGSAWVAIKTMIVLIRVTESRVSIGRKNRVTSSDPGVICPFWKSAGFSLAPVAQRQAPFPKSG
jgi:hypothetical protein